MSRVSAAATAAIRTTPGKGGDTLMNHRFRIAVTAVAVLLPASWAAAPGVLAAGTVACCVLLAAVGGGWRPRT